MEIIFTDLIAESYLIYTNNNNDIAHLYYKEQVKVKEGNNKDFFSKKEFYNNSYKFDPILPTQLVHMEFLYLLIHHQYKLYYQQLS